MPLAPPLSPRREAFDVTEWRLSGARGAIAAVAHSFRGVATGIESTAGDDASKNQCRSGAYSPATAKSQGI